MGGGGMWPPQDSEWGKALQGGKALYLHIPVFETQLLIQYELKIKLNILLNPKTLYINNIHVTMYRTSFIGRSNF